MSIALLSLTSGACIDELVGDGVDRSALILAPGTHVAELADDPVALEGLTRGMPDEVEGTMLVNQAFHDGVTIAWWDLGAASPTPVTGYLLVKAQADGVYAANDRRFAPIDHPVVRTSIPGDLGYSPLWRLNLVPVTERYAGELLTSDEAIEAAVEAGLVEPPIRMPLARNTPIVLATSRLEPAPGAELRAPTKAFYEGRAIWSMGFGELFVPGATLPIVSQYMLRREGGEPISEVERGVDMTGDGDAVDTNDLFASEVGAAGYSPLVQVVEVVVTPAINGIDSYQDQAESDLTSVAQLFEDDGRTPTPTVVRSIRRTTAVLNRPSLKRAQGE